MSELKLTFLGTGSARPTLRRGVAGLFLTYDGDAVLFDCGEGSQLQATRAGVRTSRLLGICISHFHGDHINGLPGFIGTMGLNGHRDPLVIAGPEGMERYFATLRDLDILRPSFRLQHVSNASGEVMSTKAWRIRTCPVEHRIPAWGYLFEERDLVGRFDLERARALEIPPGPLYGRLQRGESVTLEDGRTITPSEVVGATRRGRRVAYITDTRPSQRVVEFVRGADLLVHEATYTDASQDQARERYHCTASEAARVARDAGVGRLVLTHFSSKEHSAREVVREARAIFPETVAAEDLSTFSLPIPE